MFTDGVTEAMNPDFEEYGEDRLNACLAKAADKDGNYLIGAIKEDMAAHVGDAEQSDDITMLTLKRLQ